MTIIFLPVTFYFISTRFISTLEFLMILPLRRLPAVFQLLSQATDLSLRIFSSWLHQICIKTFMLPNEMKGSLFKHIIDIAIQSFHKGTWTRAVAPSGPQSKLCSDGNSWSCATRRTSVSNEDYILQLRMFNFILVIFLKNNCIQSSNPDQLIYCASMAIQTLITINPD